MLGHRRPETRLPVNRLACRIARGSLGCLVFVVWLVPFFFLIKQVDLSYDCEGVWELLGGMGVGVLSYAGIRWDPTFS
jgi:hypothetical protein